MNTTLPVNVSVLGPMEMSIEGTRVRVGSPQTRAVLALLVLGDGAVIPVDRMVERIWGENPPASAVLKVQGHVSALRKVLRSVASTRAGGLLVTRPPGYQLVGEAYACDMHEFTTQAKQASALAAAGEVERARDLLGQALRWWRGPAFADVPCDDIQLHAVRLNRLRSIAVEDRARLDLRLGRFWSVLEELGPEVDSNPLDERAREILIHAYLGLGQRHAALACYEDGKVQLRDELGISPGPALQHLAHCIRHGSAPGVGAKVEVS